ncbi:MAG: VWA domain-containing protein [Gemmatimonadota bacterium]|nr:MAG: VWA domain-containing protein [Gemmatimonadota bacterium]
MMFARPAILLLLLSVPLWLWWRRRRKGPVARYSDLEPVSRAGLHRRWIAEIPVGLRATALTCWITAAAGPQLGAGETEVTSEGIAIVLAVDISSSMLAEDFAPSNRLDVAKQQSISFIEGRDFDRIGLVLFAAEALTRIPITVDYAVLTRAVSELRVGELEDGTAIGTAIATAANRLRRAPGVSKVIVLLTDGENNRGTIDPRTAAEAAGKLGIKVYTIGVGTDGEARIPIGQGSAGQIRYQTLPVQIDEQLLREVASTTGGRYFRALDAEALSRIFQQIDQLETTPVTITRYTESDEWYRPLLWAGLLALVLELSLSATVVVRVP